MSVDLSILVQHQLQADDLVLLPSRVKASAKMRQAAERLWGVMKERWKKLGLLDSFFAFTANENLAASELEAAWARGDTPSFEWAGFHIYAGRRAIHATHLEKLIGFVLDLDHLRQPLRMCALALAQELGSSQVVFGPDSASPYELASEGFMEGRSLQEILQVAIQRCGPPAHDIRSMADENEQLVLEGSCYFVETVSE
ncbi:MAG: hypothetical protein ACT4TC_07660 [Myxococcaceae bacterium]